MANVSATVTFDQGGNTVEVGGPSQGGKRQEIAKQQAQGQTAAGDLYTYDKDVDNHNLDLTFAWSKTDWENFRTWWDTYADGMSNTFSYTDIYGTTHSVCQFLTPDLAYQKQAGALYRVQLRIRTGESVE